MPSTNLPPLETLTQSNEVGAAPISFRCSWVGATLQHSYMGTCASQGNGSRGPSRASAHHHHIDPTRPATTGPQEVLSTTTQQHHH
jgi:hypothetical protein